jgi:choline dehydrogenase-like flavoprotein
MRICVVGAGAIGGVIAARLAATANARTEVSVLARGATLYPATTHSMAAGLADRLRWMLGRATLTMKKSRMSVRVTRAELHDTGASHRSLTRRRSPRRRTRGAARRDGLGPGGDAAGLGRAAA